MNTSSERSSSSPYSPPPFSSGPSTLSQKRRSASSSCSERSSWNEPRSRYDATCSLASPFGGESAAASSAQRASWKLRRSAVDGATRLAAARGSPCRSARVSRAWPASSTGSRSVASTTAQRSPWHDATSAPWPAAAIARSRSASAARGSATAYTSTAEREPTPNGRSRAVSSVSSSSPASASARTSPASRRSVSRIARWRISSSATTVTDCSSVSRSESPRPPPSSAAASHACGPPRLPVRTGSTRARAPSSGWSGTNGAALPRVRARLRSSALIASTASSDSSRWNAREASAFPRGSSTTTAPPIVAAMARTSSSSPRSSSSSRSSRRCTAMLRCSTSYCSLTSAANAFSVIAMNGSAYGTSNTGNDCARASSSSASGIVSWSKPVPNPSPATWCDASRSTSPRCASGVSSCMPVVRISSPPESHGVGSGSSDAWTQRIGAPAPSRPATRSSPISSIRPWTVSIVLVVNDFVPRLRQDGAQDAVDLLELRGVSDQRGRELDDGVAAVVGAADQPVLVQRAGQEAAQQHLRLLVAEALLGLPVLDELDRLEVARAAHVADDRQVAVEPLEHLAELRLLLAHVAAEVLALEDVEVRHRYRRSNRVAAERDAVGEHLGALHERLRDPVVRDHGAHGRVRRRDPLRRGDEVRRVVVALRAEPVT